MLSVFVVSHAHSLSVVYVRSFPLPNEHRLNRFLKISLSLSANFGSRLSMHLLRAAGSILKGKSPKTATESEPIVVPALFLLHRVPHIYSLVFR